jgi:hypothetical protein
VIESDPEERPTDDVFYEEYSSDDAIFHTPSTIGLDSDVWVQDDQVSITTKPDDDDGTTQYYEKKIIQYYLDQMRTPEVFLVCMTLRACRSRPASLHATQS